MTIKDTLNRPLRDLRISVTDRCNFRCRYCMPAEVFGANYAFLPREQILRFGEIVDIARCFVRLGVSKLRLTGGEPLMRRDLSILVAELAKIEGVDDIAMTTNGAMLERHAKKLFDAGLHRVTVSLDALDGELFGKMNGVGAQPEHVIAGIDEALKVGLGVKLNVVVQKGVNESELLPLARFAHARRIPIRFIEFMDTGNTNGWKLDQVLPSSQVLELLSEVFDLEPIVDSRPGATAKSYGLAGVTGFEVGFISSVTQPFCVDCNRMRLSADGHLYSCLFAGSGYDIKSPLRAGESNAELTSRLRKMWGARADRYSEIRSEGGELPAKMEMNYLGG